MIEKIFSYILEHFPVVGLAIGLIAITTLITIQVIKLIDRIKKVEKSSHKSDHEVLPRLDKKLDKIGDTLIGFKVSFAGLVSYLSAKDVEMDASLYIIQSPVKLSELGFRLLTEYKGKQYVDANIANLLTELKERELATALDVENQAIMTILEYSDTVGFNEIKNYLYFHPAYTVRNTQYAFPLATLARVMGIYLRDIYLQQYDYSYSQQMVSGSSEQVELEH
jgi:hypothetical protein